MPYWTQRYRMIRRDKGHSIASIRYLNGIPDSYIADAVALFGESAEELKGKYELIAEAFDKPALDADTLEEIGKGK